jgi:methionyl-tRNA formyltransferase
MGTLKVIYAGSRNLSSRCLDTLYHYHETKDIEILGIVCYPQNKNRWWKLSLRSKAKTLGLRIIKDEELEDFAMNSDVNLIISVLYWKLFREPVLSKPDIGIINLHQALLPKYRGSMTFSHAIINARNDDDWTYGTTLHWINAGTDTGPIISTACCDINEDDTALSLYNRVEEISARLFDEWINKIIDAHKHNRLNEIPRIEQGQGKYYYSKNSLEKEISIDLLKNQPIKAYDIIRALDFPPFEPAYVVIDGRKVYLRVSF